MIKSTSFRYICDPPRINIIINNVTKDAIIIALELGKKVVYRSVYRGVADIEDMSQNVDQKIKNFFDVFVKKYCNMSNKAYNKLKAEQIIPVYSIVSTIRKVSKISGLPIWTRK